MLVIQSQEGFVDQSQAIRSAERVAQNLAEVVPTEDFLYQAMDANPQIKEGDGTSQQELRRSWNSMVDAQANGSFINIDVFTPNQKQAESLASTTAFILSNRDNLWHGGGDAITVKTIDSPLTSANPVKPDTRMNIIIGALVGFILAVAFVSYLSYFARIRREKKQNSPQ